MIKKKIILIFVVIIVIIAISATKFLYKKPVVEESLQIQVLENFFKPLDLAYFYLAFVPNNLPKYEITATNTDLVKLYNTLPKTKDEAEINQKRIVDDRKYINSTIKTGGKIYKARMTIRGINYRNYLGEKKSLRVRIEPNQNAPINAINFIVPEERAFIDDLIAYKLAQKLIFFALRPGFAWVNLNGVNVGVFQTLEDQEDESVLTAYGFSKEDIFYSPEYKPQVLSGGVWANLFDDNGTWKVNNENHTQKDPFAPLNKLKEVNKLAGYEFYMNIQKVIDIDQYHKYSAANYLMGDLHQDNTHNRSLLYQNKTGLIWFVPNNSSVASVKSLQGWHFNDFTEKMLSFPQFFWDRNKILYALVNDNNLRNELVGTVEQTYNLLKAPIYQDGYKPFRFIAFKADMRRRKEIIDNNFATIQNYFSTYKITVLQSNGLMEIKTNAFFQPILKSIYIPSTTGVVSAYFDIDENGAVSPKDKLIAMTQSNELIANTPLYSPRFEQNPIDEILPTALTRVLFVKDNELIYPKGIQITLENPFSGQILEY